MSIVISQDFVARTAKVDIRVRRNSDEKGDFHVMNSDSLIESSDHCRNLTMALHTFADLTRVSPLVFVYLLKEYSSGASKRRKKFLALKKQFSFVCLDSVLPGPPTYIIQCLNVLRLFGKDSDNLSRLILSVFHGFLNQTPSENIFLENVLVAQFFLDAVTHSVYYDKTTIVQIIQMSGVSMADIETVLSDWKVHGDSRFNATPAKQFVEEFILGLIESDLFDTAMNLLERFSILQSGEAFVSRLIQNGHDSTAERWSTYIGLPGLRVLVQEYACKQKFKLANNIIWRYHLQHEFRDVWYQYKESLLKKLATKDLWDLAEMRTKGDQRLVRYLVSLAMEAAYREKVDELCAKYGLEGFKKTEEDGFQRPHQRYLHLNVLNVEHIVWVDTVDTLYYATSYIQRCKFIGIDCEWKPCYSKGSRPNKVSIIQIASHTVVFIIDLMKLCRGVPIIVDNCLSSIFRSPYILKLGYDFHNDMQQLIQSYELDCFKQYRMLLDIQKVFKDRQGGLSGVSEKMLGARLDKKMRTSNWEQRPLSQNQLEYAALDAAVLVHIFLCIQTPPQNTVGGSRNVQVDEQADWKSCLVYFWDKSMATQKSKGTNKNDPSKH